MLLFIPYMRPLVLIQIAFFLSVKSDPFLQNFGNSVKFLKLACTIVSVDLIIITFYMLAWLLFYSPVFDWSHMTNFLSASSHL